MLSYDVVEWGKPLAKIERQTPEPVGTAVLVRLKYCGVCHSDVHIRDGYFDLGGRLTVPAFCENAAELVRDEVCREAGEDVADRAVEVE